MFRRKRKLHRAFAMPAFQNKRTFIQIPRHRAARSMARCARARRQMQRHIRHIQSLLDVQLASLSLRIHAIPIVEAIRHVAGLLNLHQRNAAAQRMHHARRNVIHVAGFHVHHVQACTNRFAALFAGVRQHIPAHALADAIDNLRVRLRIQNHPRFRLAELALFIRAGIGVIRMHLNGKPVSGGNELEQQREFLSDLRAAHRLAVCIEQLAERMPLAVAALKTGQHGHFKAFSRSRIRNRLMQGAQSLAAPRRRASITEGRKHFNRFHFVPPLQTLFF